MNVKNAFQPFVSVLIFFAVLLVSAYFFPWNKINWGKFQLVSNTITVSGYSKSQEKNEIARYTVGVSAVDDNKDKAVSEVNSKIEKIIVDVKNFGIKPDDIKTQNVSVYQMEEQYYDNEGISKSRKGQWRVDNSVELVLRDTGRASQLTDLLSASEATNFYGPGFTIDDTAQAEAKLIELAIKDAKSKAEVMARASGRKLGKIISVTEGGVLPVNYIYGAEGMGRGGGAPVESGTSTVSKTVTVTFEIL